MKTHEEVIAKLGELLTYASDEGDGNIHENVIKLFHTALMKQSELAMLLVECRDAICAIPMHAAKARGIKLDLDKRIEAAISDWAVPPGTPGAI